MSRLAEPAEKSLSTADPPTSGAGDGSRASGDISSVISPLAPGDALARLSSASKMGRLPGFTRDPGGKGFRVSVLAGIFDHDLRATMAPDAGATRISFELLLRRRLPIIMVVVIVLSVWPGLPVTDSMLRLYFPAYHQWGIETWWWYMPLLVISIPPLWMQFRRSQREARTEAGEQIAQLAKLLDGKIA